MTRFFRLLSVGLLSALMVSTPVLAATIEEMQHDYLSLIRAFQAQQITKGDGVIVGVLDTGVDAGHPDLKGALLPGYHVNQQSVAAANSDTDGHGTEMSGIIAARGGGFNNVLGIAPRAQILPVAMNFTSANISGTVAAAIRWAVDHDAKILNLSLARPSYDPLSPAEVEAVAYAQSKDVVLIVSAGNVKDLTGGNNLAELPGVVPVAATTVSGGEYLGSEKRDYNAIAAPGKDIVTTGSRTVASTGFTKTSGTSAAAAVVSGVAALIRAKYPTMDAGNVVNRLLKTAVDRGEPGRDATYGYGIVDAYAALTANLPTVSKNPLGVTTVQATNASRKTDSNTSSSSTSAADFIQLGVVLAIIGGLIFAVIRARRRKAAAALPPTPAGMPTATPPFTGPVYTSQPPTTIMPTTPPPQVYGPTQPPAPPPPPQPVPPAQPGQTNPPQPPV